MRNWLGALERHIAWTPADEGGPASVSSQALARFLAFALLVGATLALLSMILPQPEGTDYVAIYAVIAACYALAALVLALRERLPTWAGEAVLAAAVVLLTVGTRATGQPESVYAMFYVWVGLIAFAFLGPLEAVLQVVVVAIAYGILMIDQQPTAWVERWAVTVSTVLIAGLLVALLRTRLEHVGGRLARLQRARAAERSAADLNDDVVQSLVLAKYAFQRGEHERGVTLVDRSLDQAQDLIARLLREVEPEPGELRRTGGAADVRGAG
jgi:hypothetical protein